MQGKSTFLRCTSPITSVFHPVIAASTTLGSGGGGSLRSAVIESSPTSDRNGGNLRSAAIESTPTSEQIPVDIFPQDSALKRCHSLSSSSSSSSASSPSFPDGNGGFLTEESKAELLPGPTKLLMIEGDEFHVSPDGICRTLYRLVGDCGSFDTGGEGERPRRYFPYRCEYSLEERYDITHARKKFFLRGPSPDLASSVSRPSCSNVLSGSESGIARLGPSLATIELQEINHGVFGSAGTGSTSWEAAIAMSLFFASNCDAMGGQDASCDVLELGSGVGLGGILTMVATDVAIAASGGRGAEEVGAFRSMTLTDNNAQVLEQCLRNVNRVAAGRGTKKLKVSALDWNDVDLDNIGKFQTILASDCVYLYPDVPPLAKTIATLLEQPDENTGVAGGQAHMFGPYNRAPLADMVRELREVHGMEVTVSMIGMERLRLKPLKQTSTTSSSFATSSVNLGSTWNTWNVDNALSAEEQEENSTFASTNMAKFLYVRAKHRMIRGTASGSQNTLNDLLEID